jgi:FkbM family methyltransferase
MVITQYLKKILPLPLKTLLKRSIYSYRSKDFHPYIKNKKIEGVSFDFWIGDHDGKNWYDTNCTDPDWPEMRFIRDNMISEGDVVFECGGHHGCATLLLSKWAGDAGRVISFEPFPKNCEIISKNLDINHIQNVTLEQKAVGMEKGIIKIDGVSNSSIVNGNYGIDVQLTDLDYYESLKPTLLKIDVEGFEQQVFEGAKKILLTKPKIALELHTELLPNYNASVKDILGLIGIENYHFWIQINDREMPQPYSFESDITQRAHLFCIPK